MPRYIVRLADDLFVEWSTIVDAPISPGMNRIELLEYAKDSRPGQNPEEVVERVLRRGRSAMWMDEDMTPEDAVLCNRAGPNERPASLEEIIRMLTKEPE